MLKTCPGCREDKPMTDEFFWRRGGQRLDFQSRCKACQSGRWKLVDKDHLAALKKDWWDRHPEKKREYEQRRGSRPEYQRELRRRHPERSRGYIAKRDPVKRKAQRRAQWQARPDHYRTKERERYVRDRPKRIELVLVNQARRRAAGAIDIHTRRRLFWFQDGRCYYCNAPLGEGYHLDHMTPIVRSGSSDPGNLALACSPCNLRKHAQTADEFLVGVA